MIQVKGNKEIDYCPWYSLTTAVEKKRWWGGTKTEYVVIYFNTKQEADEHAKSLGLEEL